MPRLLTSYAFYTILFAGNLAANEIVDIASFFNNESKPEARRDSLNEDCPPDVRSQYVYFKHIESKGIGYKKGYSTLGLFLTPYTTFSKVLPFADLRGHIFNDGRFAANGGLGLKYLSNKPYVLGGAIYYDYRQTHRYHYNQVGLSIEALAKRWEARLNGYLPIGTHKHVRQKSGCECYQFDHFAGHNLYFSPSCHVRQKIQYAMWGVDAEYGWHILTPQEDYSLYAGIGPYYYRHVKEHALGGKIRVEGRINPYVTLEVSDSYDNLFHNNVQGQISINLPFGGKIKKKNPRFRAPCSEVLAMESRMMQPMVRQEIIVTHTQRKHFQAPDQIALSLSGAPVYIEFVNPNATSPGDGTFESPFNSLLAAEAAAGPGDIFYVYPGNNALTAPFVLVQNQSLRASSTPQYIPILVGSKSFVLTIPAQTIPANTITANGAGNEAIRLNGDNIVVSGFNIIQNTASVGGGAIDNYSSALSNFMPISNVTIINNVITQNTAHDGIYLKNVSNNNIITNNTFIKGTAGLSGIVIDEEALTKGTFTINNNTISGWENGIMASTNFTDMSSAQLTLFLSNNTISNSTSATLGGIDIQSYGNSLINANLTNNISNSNAFSGLVLASHETSTFTGRACGNTASSNTNTGILTYPYNASTMTVFLCNNTTNSNLNTGIGFFTSTSVNQTAASYTATIYGNTINNNGASTGNGGIAFPNNMSNTAQVHITISGNTLIGNDTSHYGASVYVQNQQLSNACVTLTNNNTNSIYKLENDSSNNDFYIAPPTGNTGFVDLVPTFSSGVSSAPFVVVPSGYCAPPTTCECPPGGTSPLTATCP